ncbi:tRNA adenosine(34) deaminase TadA [Aestuariirhabdus litorea]|uniref:tRNA-specific adenosine deaminase n=1 Tax=Aestuariirhabdus litorea TaxID=2528527 RepID=A0A3P3VRD3_9GAMM|nr:tRNA adenosine(34) deaminase TadA [Aestuariirhabdus litorea]RRJ85295.1 tRNA adenosine(34) deaminase TadA [Aestuariirhabdus litorea]RWW98517.1 tRNA adenosine(34) deaminase TadA [Endozoicomonadaceae bacterium GTF-13]
METPPDQPEPTADAHWMGLALNEARHAAERDEVPVGAVVVRDGVVVGRGFNQPISSCNPVAHAEILALEEAARTLGNYRLLGCTLYVTLEPCTMCAGALVHSRIDRLVYGATEPKAGAVVSRARVLELETMNHRVEVSGGVRGEECSELISGFFRRRRAQKRAERERSRGDST